MARGRKPKDPRIIELRGGTASTHRPAPKVPPPSPVIESLEPPAEDWFTADMRVAWKFWTTQMIANGTLRKIDALSLHGACAAYGNALACQKLFSADPSNWRAGSQAKRFWDQVKSFCTEFGLTLVSGAKVYANQAQMSLALGFSEGDHDHLEKLLSNKAS